MSRTETNRMQTSQNQTSVRHSRSAWSRAIIGVILLLAIGTHV